MKTPDMTANEMSLAVWCLFCGIKRGYDRDCQSKRCLHETDRTLLCFWSQIKTDGEERNTAGRHWCMWDFWEAGICPWKTTGKFGFCLNVYTYGRAHLKWCNRVHSLMDYCSSTNKTWVCQWDSKLAAWKLDQACLKLSFLVKSVVEVYWSSDNLSLYWPPLTWLDLLYVCGNFIIDT